MFDRMRSIRIKLKECIETILDGGNYIAHSLRFIKEIHLIKKSHSVLLDQLRTLSDTELKTLFLVSEKYSSKEIANLLFVTTKSIENYRSRICKKLVLPSSNNSLLVWAIENKEIIDEFEKINRFKS
jgi:DNA-binding CsgD family transcriptional regulator